MIHDIDHLRLLLLYFETKPKSRIQMCEAPKMMSPLYIYTYIHVYVYIHIYLSIYI